MKSSLTESELCEDLDGLMHRLQVHAQMDSILFLSIPHKVPKSSFYNWLIIFTTRWRSYKPVH